jgi:hypothetical protein
VECVGEREKVGEDFSKSFNLEIWWGARSEAEVCKNVKEGFKSATDLPMYSADLLREVLSPVPEATYTEIGLWNW